MPMQATAESTRQEELYKWVSSQYVAKKLAALKKQHDAMWLAAEPTLKTNLTVACNYLLKQHEKEQAAKVYITYKLQCQSDVILDGVVKLPRSYDPYEGTTGECPDFESAWKQFENYVKNAYTPNIVTPSKEWLDSVNSIFDPASYPNKELPFAYKMPDWFYNNKDYKVNCYIEYETHLQDLSKGA